MALKLLLDTNRLTDALRNDPEIKLLLESAIEIWIPFIVLAEIKAGFLRGNQAARNEAALEVFLRLHGVNVLYADRETTEIYARLFLSLTRTGTPIPTNDLWIAALAVQHGLALVTRDGHFARIPQVQRLS